MISVTTNVAALVAKRNLSENSLQATRSIAKVSQGTRIVKPMDDAASLAIANTMRTSLAGMTQGIRNTTQGSSLLQVAAGGLEQTSQMLTRMKQLAVQVINDTLGSAEISYANEEFGQLMQQIDSTAEQTRFSGKSLLTGGSGNALYINKRHSANVPNLNNFRFPALNPPGIDTSAFKVTMLDSFDTGNTNELAVIPSASSSGFVNHSFSSDPKDIEMEAFDGNFGRSIRLNVGGEYFSGPINKIRPDGEIVLTSESDEVNVIGFDLASDVSSIDTEPELLLHFKEFLTGATIHIGENKIIKSASRNIGPQNFHFEDLVDPAVTRGTVQGLVERYDDVSVTGTDNNMTVTINLSGETYRATNVDPQIGETLVLTSTTNPGNQFGLRYTLDAVGPAQLDTVAEMDTFLKGYFSTGVISGTFTNGLLVHANGVSRLMEGRVGGSLNIGGTRNMEAIDQTVTGPDGGPYDARIVVGEQTFRAQIESGLRANIPGDIIRFVSTTNSSNAIQLRVTGDLTTRAAFENDLITFTSNITYQRDGGVFDVGDPERSLADYSDSLTNGFSGFNTVNSKGFIDGIAKSVEVSGPNEGPFDITLVVGDQTFIQRGFDPTRAEAMILTSESDPENVISYSIGEGDAREHLDSFDEIKASVESLFGLNQLDATAPTAFQSASAVNNGYNGISMGNNKSILAGVATPPGKYAISYDADTRIAKLTNGVSVFEETIDPSDIREGKTTVSFGNGVTLRLGDGNNKFDIDSHISQMIFKVDQNEVVQLDFQVSDISRDDMGIKMTAATVDAMGLTGSTINGKDLAREAQDKIDLAITSINTGLANIGAQQSRFEFVRVNLTIQMENTTAARATYYDVDMGGEITDFTKHQTLTQAATSMLSQANEMPQELMRLLP